VNEAEVGSFIDELNQAFPSLDLKMTDITLVHRGVVPAVAGADGTLGLEGNEQIRDHAADGLEGLVSVAGAKYTTARAVAERIVDRMFTALQRAVAPCRTAVDPLPGGNIGDVASTIAEARQEYDGMLPSDTLPHLIAAYGSRYRDVLAVAANTPEWRTRISERSPVIGAELVWAVRHEMALTLGDAVIRRTSLGAMGDPGEPATTRAANIVGGELGWSEEKKRSEVEALRRFYAIQPA
jgi:glycerol-3-phosphate dehydrogenase